MPHVGLGHRRARGNETEQQEQTWPEHSPKFKRPSEGGGRKGESPLLVAPYGKGGSEGRIKRPLRAFKGAAATLTPEVELGGADSLCRQTEAGGAGLGAAPPRASVRQQFYGLFMQAGVPPPRPGTSNAAAPTLTPAARRP